MTAALIGLAFLLLQAPAAGSSEGDLSCRGDRGVDRCSAEQQRRVRDLFGVRSIEEHRDAGDQVRRVFYVDGYGRDLLLISFVRAPGREPMASVHFPRRDGRTPPALEASVPEAVWDDVLRRSASFDRSFTVLPPPPSRPGEERLLTACLHAWVYTIEANDPARLTGDPASLRRKTQDACGDSPGEAYAQEVGQAALPLFPACAALGSSPFRSPVRQLAECAILAGDRLAAAAVMDRLGRLGRADGIEDAVLISGYFASGARIDWNGTRSGPRDFNLDEFWVARMATDHVAFFTPERVEGLSGERVRVTGFLERTDQVPAGSEPTYSRAPVEMIWVFPPVRVFQVESVTVGPWRAYRPD